MDELLQELSVFMNKLKDKIKENEELTSKLSQGIAEVDADKAEIVKVKADLNARQDRISKVEDVVKLSEEAQAQAKQNASDFKQLRVERTAFEKSTSDTALMFQQQGAGLSNREEAVKAQEIDLSAREAKLIEDRENMKASVLAEIKASL